MAEFFSTIWSMCFCFYELIFICSVCMCVRAYTSLPPWRFSSHQDICICNELHSMWHWYVEFLCRFWALLVTCILSLPISKKWYFFHYNLQIHVRVYNITQYLCVCVCVHMPFCSPPDARQHTSDFYQLESSFKHILWNCLFPLVIPTHSVNVLPRPPTVMFLIGPQIFP